MGLLKRLYKLSHPDVAEENIPSTYRCSIMDETWHVIRKFICQNRAPNCDTNFMRVWLYRLCGIRSERMCLLV